MNPAALAVPAYIAGVLMFLAPCTLPLVPAFLGFLGGTHGEVGGGTTVRRKVFMNAVLYVVGFTVVFVALGTAFGIGGSAIANHRILLARIGGVFVVLFGLSMTGLVSLKFLERGWQVRANGLIKPGSPLGALLFGATFALGWSPCVGPILGSILLLASSSATAMSGAGLLLVFSAGLATPFLLIAAGYGHAAERTKALAKALPVISAVGGVFLIFLGTLMVFNRMDFWLGSVFKGLSWINYDGILDLL